MRSKNALLSVKMQPMSPLKSKAQIAKWGELVKEGKISESKFKEAIRATPNIHKLPERATPEGPQSRFKSVKQLRRFSDKKK